MRRIRLAFTGTIVLLLCCGIVFGIPGIGGKWKLNVEKSDFGVLPAPQVLTETIVHEEPTIRIQFHSVGVRGEISGEVVLTTDGKECKNSIGDAPMTSTASWRGDLLEINSRLTVEGLDIDSHEEWTLSPDGGILTLQRHMSSSMGEVNQTLILEKQ